MKIGNRYTNNLPKWVESYIKDLQLKLEQTQNKLDTVEKMNAVMCEPKRDWFTLPFLYDGDKPVIHLWLLNYDEPFSICSLSKGDLLFVGRAKTLSEADKSNV